MLNLIKSNFNKNLSIYLVSILYFITIVTINHIIFGNINFGGDTARLIRWADLVINNDFKFSEFYKNFANSKHSITGYFFTFFVYYLAIIKFFFKEFLEIFIFLNYFFYTLIFFYFLKKVNYLFNIKKLFFYFIFFYLFLNLEQIMWASYVLSDGINFCLVSFFFFKIYENLKINDKKINIRLYFLLIFCIFFRASNLPLLGIFLFFFYEKKLKEKIIIKFFLVSGIIISILLFTYILYNPNLFNLSSNATVNYYKNYYLNGVIIHDRPWTFLNNINSYTDFLLVFLIRFISFFKFWDIKFSLLHNLFNITFFVPTYLGALHAIIKDKTSIVKVCSYWILLFAIFHSLILIDYEWRYRLPIFIPLYFLMLISIKNLFKNINFKNC